MKTYISAGLEKWYVDSPDMRDIRQPGCFLRIRVAAVTPATPFPTIATCKGLFPFFG
ncbi:uncharacterized protein METZ01_LOCUS516867 [marine metagenome]|uniref:Uncharacterized protein n=1 Tax=marine metagenome TaxID=408172 RepID=A0A383F5Q9_9ZZZZ